MPCGISTLVPRAMVSLLWRLERGAAGQELGGPFNPFEVGRRRFPIFPLAAAPSWEWRQHQWWPKSREIALFLWRLKRGAAGQVPGGGRPSNHPRVGASKVSRIERPSQLRPTGASSNGGPCRTRSRCSSGGISAAQPVIAQDGEVRRCARMERGAEPPCAPTACRRVSPAL